MEIVYRSEIDIPSIDVVKPAVKKSVFGERAHVFENCFALSHDLEISPQNIIPGVFIFDDVLSEVECHQLCENIDSSEYLSFWSANGREHVESRLFRDADTIEVNSPIITDRIWNRVKLFFNDWILDIGDEPNEKSSEFPNLWERELPGRWEPATLNCELLFAKYPSNGTFAPHTDGRVIHDFNLRSFYSVIIFLNHIPDGMGGGTRFYHLSTLGRLVRSKDEPDISAQSSLDFLNFDQGMRANPEQNEIDIKIEIDKDGKTGVVDMNERYQDLSTHPQEPVPSTSTATSSTPSSNPPLESGRWTGDSNSVLADVAPRVGRMLVFNQSMAHEGLPPLPPHSKYIIRTDIMFRRNPAICDSERDREAYKIFRQAEDMAERGEVSDSLVLFRKALKLSPDLARLMGQG